MKFQNYVISALVVTALVPFAAWSYLQHRDIEGTLAREDRDQRLFTGIGSAFVAERLRAVEAFADYAAADAGDVSEGGQALQKRLEALTRAQPFLKVLVLEKEAGLTPAKASERWSLESRGQAGELVYRTQSASGTRLAAYIDREALLGDVAAMFGMRGVRFVLLDQNKRYIWPESGITGSAVWSHPLKREFAVTEAQTDLWVTANRFDKDSPAWTMLAVKPAQERIAQRDALIARTSALALLVIVLTALVGYAAIGPVTAALRRLRRDLDDDDRASETNTIEKGPEEFKEVQQAYRALRERLNDRHRTLAVLNTHLERTVDERSRRLAERERLFSTVFNDVREGMVLADADWSVRHANPAAESMLSKASLAKLVACCRGKYDGSAGAAVFYEEPGAGQAVVYGCTVVPFGSGESADEAGYCVLFADVTGKAQLERMKNDLISIVAHELRTPVTACRLELDLLRRESGPSRALDAMQSDLDHLSRIIDDWLVVAKIDGGVYSVNPRVVQLVTVLNRAVRLVRARHRFSVSFEIAEEAETLWADPDALLELFVNLFTNACRYARKASEAKVEVRARAAGNIVIEVADHGIGFRPQDAERLFDRFRQFDKNASRSAGGTGLGLVICRAICEAHAGSIEAECRDGETIFRVTLPAGPDEIGHTDGGDLP